MAEGGAEALAGATNPAAPDGVLDRALDLVAAGGPVVVVLFLLSIAALAIVFVKLWQFRAVEIGDVRTVRAALALYRDGRAAEALALVAHSRNPAARLLALAIHGRRAGLRDRRVRDELERQGRDALACLRAYFRPLEVIASLAPLLGLFGTVLGMIDAFHRLEQAGRRVDPAILSGGIWEALLTTAVGLAVAIPTVAALNWLDGKVERLAHEMGNVVAAAFTEDLSRRGDEGLTRAAPEARPLAAVAE